MKKIILIVALLCMTACKNETTEELADRVVNNHLVYSQDQRTGICYASAALGYNHAVLTTVDCDKVRSRIKKLS